MGAGYKFAALDTRKEGDKNHYGGEITRRDLSAVIRPTDTTPRGRENAAAAAFSGTREARPLMDIEVVREALHREPFEPFVVRLADGRSLPVRHPDFVALGKRRVFVVGEDDSTTVIEPLLIVSLDTPARKGKGDNGKRRTG
jgi:hypothetical protein